MGFEPSMLNPLLVVVFNAICGWAPVIALRWVGKSPFSYSSGPGSNQP